jgi:effector-binding domain-containing protein
MHAGFASNERRRSMLSEPKIINRGPQPYAAIRLTVERPKIGEQAPPLTGEVMAWLAAKGIGPTGAPFFNYTRMRGETMDMEIGWPTASLFPGDGRVVTGTLPEGKYATLRYTGDYSGLYAAHEALHQWLATQKLPPQDMEGGGLTLLEIYETDPAQEPNPDKWITDVAFRLSA